MDRPFYRYPMQSELKTPASRYLALKRRDPRAEGRFIYAVRTTGIYCRPTCSSKLAQRQNILFFENAASAAAKGFRACRRCHPGGRSPENENAELIAKACRILEKSEETPSLKALAESSGMSMFHFHRLFKKITGLTPKEYANAKRVSEFKKILRSGKSVTHSFYEAGFGSSGRFYEHSAKDLGMKPRAYGSGGKNERIRYAVLTSRLGQVLVAGTELGICAVRIGDEKKTLERELRREFHAASFEKPDKRFRSWVKTVVRQVNGASFSKHSEDLPLDIQGTAFQQRVWRALRTIPRGETSSYQEIAKGLGRPTASRAVARAVATNPAAVLIPCHRVVRKDGSLSGYRWGVERKRKLLEQEGAL